LLLEREGSVSQQPSDVEAAEEICKPGRDTARSTEFLANEFEWEWCFFPSKQKCDDKRDTLTDPTGSWPNSFCKEDERKSQP
jgi:hypothetical protein